MKKRMLSMFLTLCLCLSLLPMSALAADGDHWADSAVNTLNEMYNVNSLFEANDKDLSFKDAESTLDAAGWHSDAFDEAYAAKDSENDPVSRGLACEVLAEIFNLPIGNESAIEYLYEKNIINGYANGELGEDDSISMAQFAVVTYRILNSIGGGASSTTGLTPGTVEYNSWMFLTNRGVVDKDNHEGNIDESTWNEWIEKLDSENAVFEENTLPLPGKEGENVTKLQAAVDLMNAYVNAGGNGGKMQVFSDVRPDDWFYDGIMYLFDHGIVMGYGSDRIGQFGPNDQLTNGQLASLLCRASGINTDPGEVDDKWTASQKLAIKAANDNKWMTVDEDSYDTEATREIAIAAVIKWLNDEFDDVNVDKKTVNTDILDRFNDGNTVSDDNAPYVAYAVSIGILNGDADGNLSSNAVTTRAMFGVIMYRVLIGVDETKMKDYEDNVEYAKGGATVQTFALRAATTNTLTLREDWRLTSELDLNTNEPLIIDGNGHYIYEMGGETGGKLLNSGTGVVTFQNTALYPAPDDADAADITPDGIWDAGESNQLMLERQPHIITVSSGENGTVTASTDKASKGSTVTLTVAPEQGYELDTLTVTAIEGSGGTVSVSNDNSFTMPASDVTVSATFKQAGTVTPPTYTVTTPTVDNGSVNVSPKNASKGDTVTITVKPDDGYELDELIVTDKNGDALKLTDKGNGKYTFTMPGSKVEIEASFVEIEEPVVVPAFTDVPADAYYADAVEWAVKNGITVGTGDGTTFSPDQGCTRAQVVTFLWRAAGSPAPKSTVNPFVDVLPGEYYAEAVLWAVENGITVGTNAEGTTFSPDEICSRAQIVTFLWRSENRPAASTSDSFVDVANDTYYAGAVEWAAENKIALGTNPGGTMFSPDEDCTRAQIVTFLYRCMA